MPLTLTATVADADKHSADVTTLLFYGDKLYSGGEDGKVKVWTPDLRPCGEFQAHETAVFHLAAIHDNLYTCSNDGTIRSWKLGSLEPHKTLLQYDDETWRLYVANGKLYSGDIKGNVRVWQDDELHKIYDLTEEIRDLIVIGDLLYTVRDRDVVITEVIPGSKKSRFMTRKTLEGSSPMCVVGGKLCFATRSARDISVHDNSKETTFKHLGELQGHELIINALCGSEPATLYSGGWDNKVKQWDLEALKNTSTCEVGFNVNTITTGSQGEVFAAGGNCSICKLDSKIN